MRKQRLIRTFRLGCFLASLVTSHVALAEDPTTMPYGDVEAAARGGTVNFYLWGGDERINAYVSGYLGDRLKTGHDITLHRVGLADTAEAVNQVLSEKDAGITDTGAVDLIWINGNNFRAMKNAGLLTCGYTDKLPNSALINWTDPTISSDFGTPVDGCEVPWSRAQFAMAYDSARLAEPPRTVMALIDWIKAHPGRFTYAAPPDFNGAVFVRHVFYAVAGGADKLAGPFDQAKFDAIAPKVWALLNDLEPSLWREGATYPTDINQLNQLYGNGEVDFTFNYDPAIFGTGVLNGQFPATTRSYAFDDGTIGNTSYVAIPFNAANKAAAMVAANELISVAAQLEKAKPEVWGMATVLDMERLPAADVASFGAIPRPDAVVAPSELAARIRPELTSDWVVAIEKGWIANVGTK